MVLCEQSETAQLDLNENPQRVSLQVQQAIQQAMMSLNRYPRTAEDLETQIARYLGHGLTSAHIIAGAGGSSILHKVAATCIGPEDEAIIPIPAFPVYAHSVKARGGLPVLVEHGNSYQVDVNEILQHVNKRTRVVYVCSPHNPTGTYCSQAQLDHLMAQLPASTLLVFDEVYWHFGAHPDRARPWRHLQARPNLLIIHSFSKAFGLAGLRLGYGIAQPELITRLKAISALFSLNQLTLAAGAAALQDQAFVTSSIALIQEQRAVLYEGLRQLPGIATVIPSEASFVAFRPRLPSTWVVDQLEARNIRVRELSGFTMSGWVRVSVGNPPDNQRFLTAIAEVLENGPQVEQAG